MRVERCVCVPLLQEKWFLGTYEANIRWQRQPHERFVDGRYSRAHEWLFDGGAKVHASASPHAVRPPFARRILVRDGANAGWINYMLKDRQKSEFDGFVDCIIIDGVIANH